MKELSLGLACFLGLTLAANSANRQTLITFDDLALQGYGGPIPNGYAGLQWDEFGVLDPEAYPGDSVGYMNGMVSSGHVGFNAYANPDGTVTGGFHTLGSLFDLNSAYLTAAWNDDLQVQVLGFVEGVLTYSNSYRLNTTGPTLVDFNYTGIDRVEFISFGGAPHGDPGGGGTMTVIDSMVITMPETHSQIRVLTEHKLNNLFHQLQEVDFEQLPVSSDLNPAVPNPLLLEGVLFSDPFQLDTGFCASPTCEPDPDNSNGGNIVLFLSRGATITFTERPKIVVLDLQGMGDNSFSLLVSDGRDGTRSVSGKGVLFGAALLGVSSPFGIRSIQVQSLTDGNPLVLARVLFSTR